MSDNSNRSDPYESIGKLYTIYNVKRKQWYHISRNNRWRQNPRYYTLKQLRFAMTVCSFSSEVMGILKKHLNIAEFNTRVRHCSDNEDIEIHTFEAPTRSDTKRVTDFYTLVREPRYGKYEVQYCDPNPKKKIKAVMELLKDAAVKDPDLSVDDIVELVRRGLTTPGASKND